MFTLRWLVALRQLRRRRAAFAAVVVVIIWTCSSSLNIRVLLPLHRHLPPWQPRAKAQRFGRSNSRNPPHVRDSPQVPRAVRRHCGTIQHCAYASKWQQRIQTWTHRALHLHRITTNMPSTCYVCNAVFRRNEHLNRHLLRHLGARPFKCRICGNEFARRYCFHLHERYDCPQDSPIRVVMLFSGITRRSTVTSSPTTGRANQSGCHP